MYAVSKAGHCKSVSWSGKLILNDLFNLCLSHYLPEFINETPERLLKIS